MAMVAESWNISLSNCQHKDKQSISDEKMVSVQKLPDRIFERIKS